MFKFMVIVVAAVVCYASAAPNKVSCLGCWNEVDPKDPHCRSDLQEVLTALNFDSGIENITSCRYQIVNGKKAEVQFSSDEAPNCNATWWEKPSGIHDASIDCVA